jgi:hypothetical protein
MVGPTGALVRFARKPAQSPSQQAAPLSPRGGDGQNGIGSYGWAAAVYQYSIFACMLELLLTVRKNGLFNVWWWLGWVGLVKNVTAEEGQSVVGDERTEEGDEAVRGEAVETKAKFEH